MRGVVLVLLLPAPALAQAPTIQASVDSQSTTLDDTVTLQITIEAPAGSYDRYEPPDLSDFVVVDTGRQMQSQFLMQGGRLESRSTETFSYALRARRTGDLVIGAARLHARGQVEMSQSITIQVRPGAQGGSAPLATAPPGGSASPGPPPEDESLFLQVSADRIEVWVGEQVNVTWSLYTQSDLRDYRASKDPGTDAFWVEDLYTPTHRLQFERQIVAGRLYFVAPLLKKALFPLREGELVVGPLEADLRTVASSLLATGSVVRRTPELTIRARPLPVEGRPAGFSPTNVGRFTVQVSAERTQVEAGEPIRLRLVVRGTGNIRGLKAPALRAPGFKVYDPKVEDRIEPGEPISGEKRIEYVLLPTAGGESTIPGFELPFFDPVSGSYAVARTEPISVVVIGDPTAVELRGRDAARDNVLAVDIRPIRHRTDLRRAAQRPATVERLLPVVLAAPPAGYLAVLGVGLLRARSGRDTPASRRRRSQRQARHHLRLAEQRLGAGDAAGFFAEAARAIQERLTERLGQRVEGMTRDELSSLLSRLAGADLATAVLTELDNCDLARFAPSAVREGEMRACLSRLPELLGRIEGVS